jgi:chemotaxis protein MotB
MRNVAIIVLSAVLAAAIVFGILLYGRYLDTKDALLVSEKNVSELGKKVTQLDRENFALHDQIRKNAEPLEKLNSTKERISELEEKLRTVKKHYEEAKKTNEEMATDLEERLQASRSHIRYLEEETARQENEIQGLHHELLALRGEKTTVETKMGQMKSFYEALISEHPKKLESAQGRIAELKETISTLKRAIEKQKMSKNAMVTDLEERLQASQSLTRSLEQEIAKQQAESEKAHRQLLNLKGEKALVEGKMGRLKSTYEALISDLKQQIENQEVSIKSFQEKISVTFVDRILFESGKATISLEGKRILKKVGEILKSAQGRQIRVVGHTDNIPILAEYRYKFPSNWELSAARAAAVVRDFQKRFGLDPKNMEAVGRSLYEPIASNVTDEGRAQNRRVEIIIAPKIE